MQNHQPNSHYRHTFCFGYRIFLSLAEYLPEKKFYSNDGCMPCLILHRLFKRAEAEKLRLIFYCSARLRFFRGKCWVLITSVVKSIYFRVMLLCF